MAQVISSKEEDLIIAARQINKGGLVAFPTETVYGLGARLDDKSLSQIFAVKHRPYSDPIICHYDTAENARKGLILTEEENTIFYKLAKSFWPGPLTIVGPAVSAIPPLVMAGTGCVGVRVPSHPIAHRFLELCGESVAAPSANLFGHVSPTSIEHVMNDLGNTAGLIVISGGKATIGIESTVVRLVGETITVLRPGFITIGQLDSISPGNAKYVNSSIKSLQLASPGHEKSHYAPNLDTFLAKIADINDKNAEEIPKNAVIIDFNRKFASISSKALRYFDLSPVGCVSDAINKIYDTLREAETTPGAKLCLIAYFTESGKKGDVHDNELVSSLFDRLLRSSSHRIRTFKL